MVLKMEKECPKCGVIMDEHFSLFQCYKCQYQIWKDKPGY